MRLGQWLPRVVATLVALTACTPAAAPTAAPTAAPAAPPAATVAPTAAATTAPTAVPVAKPVVTAAPTTAPAAAATVKVGYSNITGDQLPLWYSSETGLFAAHGLDVDSQLVAGGATTVAALLSGQIQVAQAGGSEALSATANGADLVVVATLGPVYPYIFEVVPEIQTPQDLIGKKIGVATLGGSADIATRVALRSVGIDPNKDVTIVATGSAANRTAALLSGAIQAGMAGGPPDTLELEAHGLHPIMDLAALKLPNANNTVMMQRTWLDANRAVAQRYIDTLIEATGKLKKDKTTSVAILKKYYNSDNEVGMTASYDFFTEEVLPNLPFPRPEQLKDSVEQLGASNPKVLEVKLDRLLDPSLVQNAADRGLGG
jgi:NitT/TauT family transport system substrate-binding protein